MSGADQYTVWNTDNAGNFNSVALPSTSGSSSALRSLEPSFHQDLNGDGVIGSSDTIISSLHVSDGGVIAGPSPFG